MKKPITSLPAIERRFTSGRVEVRNEGEGQPKKVRGYAAIYNQESENLGTDRYQFREVIEPGAFDDVLKDDVRALFNHNPSLILARSKNGEGTLKIGVDDVGLWYEFEAPDTQAGRDLMVSIERGDVDQSSFGFEVTREGQKWEETADGDKTILKRTILKVSRLHDVSPVTYPAYPDTTVALRSLEEFQRDAEEPQSDKEPPLELWEMHLRLLKTSPVSKT